MKPFKMIEVERGDEFLADQHFASPENFRRALVRSSKLLLALAHSDLGKKMVKRLSPLGDCLGAGETCDVEAGTMVAAAHGGVGG
jgi:hypothetical protein